MLKITPILEKIEGLPTHSVVPMEVTEGEFKGCQFYLDNMQMADKENEDGSMDMSYEYTILNHFKVTDDAAFSVFLGESIIDILRKQIAQIRKTKGESSSDINDLATG